MQNATPVRLTELLRLINPWERFGWVLAGFVGLLILLLGIADAGSFANTAWKIGYLLALLQSVRIAWEFELSASEERRFPTFALLLVSLAGLVTSWIASSLSLSIVSCGVFLAAFACRYEQSFTWLHGLTIVTGSVLFSMNKPILSIIEKHFVEASTNSLSPLLDFLGLPNMAFVNAIQTKSQWIDVGEYCFGSGSLAWLAWLVIVYLQHRPRSLIVTLTYSALLVPVAMAMHFAWVLLTVWFGTAGDYLRPSNFSVLMMAWLAFCGFVGIVFIRFNRLLWLPIQFPVATTEQGLATSLFNSLVSWPNPFAVASLPTVSNSVGIGENETIVAKQETPSDDDEAADRESKVPTFSPVFICALGLWVSFACCVAARLGLEHFLSSGEPSHPWTEIASGHLQSGGYGEAKSVQPFHVRETNAQTQTTGVIEHSIEIGEVSASVFLIPNRNTGDISNWMLEYFHAVLAPNIEPAVESSPATLISRDFKLNSGNSSISGQYYYQFFPKHQYLFAWGRDVRVSDKRLKLGPISWRDRGRELFAAWLKNEPLEAGTGFVGFVIQSNAPIGTNEVLSMQAKSEAVFQLLEKSTP